MSDLSAKIEHYEKRFGIVAIELGYISHQDLVMALKTQIREDFSDVKHRLLRIILLDENKMTGRQVEVVMEILLCKSKMDSRKAARVIQFPIQVRAAVSQLNFPGRQGIIS